MIKKCLTIFTIIFAVGSLFMWYFCSKSENLYPINDQYGGGYINKFGKVVIEQKYHFAFPFVGDFAITQNNNLKYGIINKKGNVVIDATYDKLEKLSENYVIYKENGKYGFIDIKNNKKFKAKYDNIREFKEDLAAICINGRWGFVNKNGKIVIFPQYYEVANFSERLAAVSYSNHKTSAYINKNGKTVISFDNNHLAPKEFHEGIVPVIKEKDKSCSYINKKGEIVIDNAKIYPINIYCGNFSNGVTVFYIDNKPNEITTGYINKQGKIKYSQTFSLPKNISNDEFSVFENFNSNMAQYTIDYKTGYIDSSFKIKTSPIYEFAKDFNNDLAYVKYEEKEGYINKKGKFVWTKPRSGM